MEMTNALSYRVEKLIPEQFFYQMLKQTVSSPFSIQCLKQDLIFRVHFSSANTIKKPNRPVTTREQLMLISAFFGFSKSNLGEIFGVTRQSIYNWFDNAEIASVHYEKMKRLANIAFDIDPEPSQQIFHIYANDVIKGYDKSLFNYLLDDNFDEDIVFELTKTIYEMSRERWKRIDSIPKAKHRQDEL